MPSEPVSPSAMAEHHCCEIDAESFADLFETTVEVPLGMVLAGGCCCRCC